MEQKIFNVIIVGAGAAGLMAAWELVQAGKEVAILEGRKRVGGRILTLNDPNFEIPIDTGAEFVHGDLELTQLLFKKAGINTYEISGEIWQKKKGELQEQEDFIEDYPALNKKFKELKNDISVFEFIESHLQDGKFEKLRFTLKNYVEGYYAADTKKASTFALREELNNSENKQYQPEGGYMQLIDYIKNKCELKGAQIFLNNIVEEIRRDHSPIEVKTNLQNFQAEKILITVPIGVLQNEQISFDPAIPSKINAAKKLGYGPAIKTILQFESPFWKKKEQTQQKNLSKLNFIFSDAFIPTWWTKYPKGAAILTGWSGGPHAEKMKGLNDDERLQKAIYSLSEIFNIDVMHLRQQLKAWHISDWMSDPFSCGAYSYEVVNGMKEKAIIREPINNSIFFAGEGLYDGIEIGTVEAALISGRDIAQQIIANYDK